MESKYLSSNSNFSSLKCVISFKKSKKYYITFNLLNLLLSLGCIGIYIFLTYRPNVILKNNVFFLITFVCDIYFLFDFIMDMIMMGIESSWDVVAIFVDVLSFFPFILIRGSNGMKFVLTDRIDMICASLVVFRIFRVNKFSHFFKSDVNRELVNIACTILSLLLVPTVVINSIENTQTIGRYWLFVERDCFDSICCNGSNDHLHTTLYFVFIVLSTVGYYSSINSFLGRCGIIVLIALQLFLIGNVCANLVTLLMSKSIYARTSYSPIDKVDFIVITGNISMGSIDCLLKEYFHPDHGENEKHALVLLPTQPEPTMKKLLQKYQNRLFYLEGNCLKLNDLERCGFDKAKTIMLLSNKQSDDPMLEDSDTVIKAMTIKKFLLKIKEGEKKEKGGRYKNLLQNKIASNSAESEDSNLDNIENRLAIQLMRPETQNHFETSVSNNSNQNQLLCIDGLKLSFFAKSCLCKGIITLLANLITTNSIVEHSQQFSEIINKNQWLNAYIEGKDYEIYRISLDTNRGFSFSELAQKIYKSNRIILFGLNIESVKSKNNIDLLSPFDFVLPEDDPSILIYGYLLAKNQEDANFALLNLRKFKSNKKKSQSPRASELFFAATKKKDDEEDFGLNERRDQYFNERLILAQTFHITSEQIPKENAICTTLENKLFVKKGHIIVCGINQNLLDFIKPLRAKHLPKSVCPTIVILTKEIPDDKVWRSMSYFDELFIVQGDPLNKQDLKRAWISTASKVVILAPTMSSDSKRKNKDDKDDKSSSRKLTSEDENSLDFETIFKYNLITNLRKDIYCIIELINPENVTLLNNKTRINNDEYLFIKEGMDISLTASFAAGEIYYSNMMDNLMSQLYYNPNLLGIINKMIVGEKENEIQKRELRKYLNIESGNVYLLDMPNLKSLGLFDLSQLVFGQVFERLLIKHKMLVIGVYKEIPEQKSYCVVTSPRVDFKLSHKDRLFVISTIFPFIDGEGDIIMENRYQIDAIENFNMEKNFGGPDRKKAHEERELKKEYDKEGENRLISLINKIKEMKNNLVNVKKSISAFNNDSKNRIATGIHETFSELGRNNK